MDMNHYIDSQINIGNKLQIVKKVQETLPINYKSVVWPMFSNIFFMLRMALFLIGF